MRFEDLEIWKRSARLSAELYKAFSDCRDFGFRDQITRSVFRFQVILPKDQNEVRRRTLFGFFNIQKALVVN